MGSAVIFSGSDVKALKSNLDLNGNAKILSGSVDPSSVATTAPIGSVYLNSTNGNLYKKQDAGSSTNWVKLSVGGDAGINYITNANAEQDVTGWSAYADAAGVVPVDGTGGSPTVTITRSTSSPLRGVGSFLITKDASDRQGEGISIPFVIDSADQAKALIIGFDYNVASGTFVSGDSSDIRVFIYDVTNSVLIQPAPITIQGNSSGTSKFIGTFQTASNSTSYRLILHCATTSASDYTLKLDNIQVGPIPVSYTSPMSDWTSYTPTGTWSSNTTYTGKWRRVGDSMEVQVNLLLAGAPTAAELSINLPSGYTIDTAKLSAGTAGVNNTPLGLITILDSGTAVPYGRVQYTSTTAVKCMAEVSSGTYITPTPVDASTPMTWAINDELGCFFRVPIAGWSSSAAVSQTDSSEGRVVSLGVTGNPASATSGNPIIFPTTSWDTHAGYNATTGRYTCPASGYYRVHGFIGADVPAISMIVYVNAASVITVGVTMPTYLVTPFSGTVKCNAGDIIDLRPNGTIDADGSSSMFIERLPGNQSIMASESVNARYKTAAAQSITNGGTEAIVDFGTKDFDSHGAVTVGASWKFTAPMPGVYRVSAAYLYDTEAWVAGNLYTLSIYKNGSIFTTVSRAGVEASTTDYRGTNGATSIKLAAGDYIDIRISNNRTAGNTSLIASADYNSVSIERVGN